MSKVAIRVCVSALFFSSLLHISSGFVMPEVKIEALAPKGIKVSIPNTPGVEFFGFHGRKNNQLYNTEPGEITAEINTNGNQWSFTDKSLELKVGDTIYYWYYIQHNRLGYRKTGLSFTITELVQPTAVFECTEKSKITKYNNGKVPCFNEVIFEDNFNQLDENKWQIQEYFPIEGPDYEFNSYRKNSNTYFISNSVLYLQQHNNTQLRDNVNLGSRCTKKKNLCKHIGRGKFIYPLMAGQVKSMFSFQYGIIEITAKLPEGDWIYPIMHLTRKYEDIGKNITIAFARGNPTLTDQGQEVGNKVLYAWNEAGKVVQKSYDKPISEDYHIFKLNWAPDSMTFYMDDIEVGSIAEGKRGIVERNDFENEYQISLGVAVGGNTYFPENSTSAGVSKPWITEDADAVFNFYSSLSKYQWDVEKTALKIQKVLVRSL